MSTAIPEWFVKQYSSNVLHLSQQKGSKLQDKVRKESQAAEAAFYDRIGAVDAVLKNGRHEATTYSNTPHSRRKVTLAMYFYADLVDKEDKVKLLNSPESEYVTAAVNALGRVKDDVIIAAGLGTSYSGVDGATAVVLPDAQKVAAHDGSTTTGVNLNVKTLRVVKGKFDAADVDESIKRFFAITSYQLQSLLAQTEITSGDYNSIKALVQGDVNTFMGFEFIRTERLARAGADVAYNVVSGVTGSGTGTITAANSRRCMAWAQDGILLATAQDITAKIDVLPTMHYSTQVYASLMLGATRMEEAKVVEVICSE
jgi:hypothetical protein